SALVLCAEAGNWNVCIEGENAAESPYVVMTSELMKVFPKQGGKFRIEPDASSGSYFLAASELMPRTEHLEYSEQFGVSVETSILGRVSVANWPSSGWQIDQQFGQFAMDLKDLLWLGADFGKLSPQESSYLRERSPQCVISRTKDLGDSIMTAIVLSPLAIRSVQFTDLGRLRVQECERVFALRTELTK